MKRAKTMDLVLEHRILAASPEENNLNPPRDAAAVRPKNDSKSFKSFNGASLKTVKKLDET